MLSRKNLIALGYLFVLAAVNIYVIREMFVRESTAHMNAMHGVWIAMARIHAGQWFHPTWWPLWAAGMPFEYTYAPLVPGLTAIWSAITGTSASHAYHFVSGLIYCLGPLTLFLMAWRLSGSAGYSFAAGLVYSLLAPTELLLPETVFRWREIGRPWRLYLAVVWDETPHLSALAMLPLIVLFLYRSLDERRPKYYLLAGLFISLAMLGSAYGATMTGLATICLLFALGKERWIGNAALAFSICATSYLIVCPFYPPSLIALIRTNAAKWEPWTMRSTTTLCALILAWSILWWAARGMRNRFLRFVLFFALLTSSSPSLVRMIDGYFLPQPDRYKIEMEMALALGIAFGARAIANRLPDPVRAALALLLLSIAVEQVISHRKFAKASTWQVDMTTRVEYRVSRWLEQNMPGQRVLLSGSLGQWANAFTGQPQLGGGAFTTAPNWNQQLAIIVVYTSQAGEARDVPMSLLWLKAFGVQAVAMPDAGGEEFWKPIRNPKKFEGVLPVLWREKGTTIYRVPQRTVSLAHVIDGSALVRHELRDGMDVAELEPYVVALENPALPVADLQWQGFNRIKIHAETGRGQVVSVQVNYHPGWHARANGAKTAIGKDGLGFMYVRPAAAGPCDIELNYDGGWEYVLCRVASLMTLIAVTLYAWKIWY